MAQPNTDAFDYPFEIRSGRSPNLVQPWPRPVSDVVSMRNETVKQALKQWISNRQEVDQQKPGFSLIGSFLNLISHWFLLVALDLAG
jgi:hypothetical protein